MEVPRTDSVREQLILKFMPTAKRLARVWGKTTDTLEEAEADLFVKLVELIDVTPDEKITEPYIAESLRNCLRARYIRTKEKKSTIPANMLVSLDQPLPGQEHLEEPETLADVLPDENAVNPEQEAISKNFVRVVLAKLTDTQRKLVSRHLGLDGMDPVPMDRVAKGLRLSRTVAYYEFNNAKTVLRDELIAMGYTPSTDSDLREILLAA